MTSQKNNLDVSSNQESRLTSSITFDDFIAKYEPLINKLTHKYFLENHTKDDIRQIILMVMYRVWQNIFNTYDETKGSGINGYIYKSIAVEMKSRIEKKQVETHNLQIDETFQEDRHNMFKSGENVDAKDYTKRFEDELWEFVNTLKYGKTVRYYYKGGMTLERIAEIQGVSFQAIEYRLKKTYKLIKEHFGDDIYKYLQKIEKS